MDLSQPQVLREFLRSHGLEARKGLGQHFLCSATIVRKIAEELGDVKGCLEIGPGPGALTSMLCEHGRRVVALELDDRMIAALRESAPCAEVYRVNALDVELLDYLEDLPRPTAIVSNLPYYITGPLVTRISAAKNRFELAILMMQREVALRAIASPKYSARGSLSVFLQLQFDIVKVADVPPGAFLPPPKVESVVLSLKPKRSPYPAELEQHLFLLIRSAFRQPRKTLANNLAAMFDGKREFAESAISSVGLPLTIRPQELSNEDWLRLLQPVSQR